MGHTVGGCGVMRLLHVMLVNMVTVPGCYMQCLMVLAGCYDVIIFDVDNKDGSTGMNSSYLLYGFCP